MKNPSFRFITQWITSEKRRESIIPISFWCWSNAGSLIPTFYWFFRCNPIGIVTNLPSTHIHWQNLRLIKQSKLAPIAAAPTQTPHEKT